MKRILIGFSGKIGSGKNFIAEEVFLPKLFDVYSKTKPLTRLVPYFFSFGDHLKVECLCRKSYDDFKQNIAMHRFFVEKDQSTRDMLQKYGTENGRHVFHQDIWVRAVETWINIQESRLIKLKKQTNTDFLPVFIISDVRFENEANFILSNNGLLIRINAPNRSEIRVSTEANNDQIIMNKIRSHLSEKSLDDFNFQFTILNDDTPFDVLNIQADHIISNNIIANHLQEDQLQEDQLQEDQLQEDQFKEKT